MPPVFKKLLSYIFGQRIATYTSQYSGPLEVWQVGGKMILHSENANQSFDSLHRVFQYIFQAIELKINPPKSVLLLGLGGGSVLSILRTELEIFCPIDAVEYDDVVIEIANKHFNISRYNNLTIHQADAYEFVQTATKQYNLICVDLFNDNKVAARFYDEQFNAALLSLLKTGSIVFNTIVNDTETAKSFVQLEDFYNKQQGVSVQVLYPETENRVLIVNKGNV